MELNHSSLATHLGRLIQLVPKEHLTMSAVVEINEIRQLANYRLLWNALFGQTEGADFFRTLDWLTLYWKHFAQPESGERLRALIVYAGQRPIGVLPLVVRPVRHRFGTARALTYPLDDWGSFYGPIGTNPAATLLAGMRHIRSTPRDWDLIDLAWTDTEGPDRWRTYRAMRSVGYASRRETWGSTAILDPTVALSRPRAGDSSALNSEFEEADEPWRPKQRPSKRRDVWPAERMEFIRYRPAGYALGECEPRWNLYEACQQMPRKTWRRPLTEAKEKSSAEVEAFLQEAHLAAVRAGMLDMSLLKLDDEPIAFAYGYHFSGGVQLIQTGYNPRHGEVEPLRSLLSHMLIDSYARDDCRIDLGPAKLVGCEELPIHWERIDRYLHCSSKGLRRKPPD